MPHTCLFTFGSLFVDMSRTQPSWLFISIHIFIFGHFISLCLCFNGCARIHLLLIAHFRLFCWCFFFTFNENLRYMRMSLEGSSTKRMKISTKYFFCFQHSSQKRQISKQLINHVLFLYALCLHTYNFRKCTSCS